MPSQSPYRSRRILLTLGYSHQLRRRKRMRLLAAAVRAGLRAVTVESISELERLARASAGALPESAAGS